jgi:hypothetical protein
MQNKKHPMQTHCLLNLSDKARLIGCHGDSGVRNAEKPSLHPSTRLIPSRKRIALVAHDKRKEKMASAIRFTGISLSYNISAIFGGGLTPLIVTIVPANDLPKGV